MAVTAPLSTATRPLGTAEPRRRQWLALASDARFDLFAGLFALSTLHHVLQQALEHQRVGPLSEYMERWSRARPTSGWPSELGVALHLSDLLIALLILVLPWRRLLLGLLALTYVPTNFASPERIPSHNSLMAAATTFVLVLAVAETIDRGIQRGRVGSQVATWYRWTIAGLVWLCVLMYVFAFVYKLNSDFFSPKTSPAAEFLVSPTAPLLARLGPAQRSAEERLALVAIYGTVTLEISVPVLLLLRQTRLVGCFLGLVLHLPMMAQGIFDFPTLALAFYPLFLSVEQLRGLLAACRRRPSALRLALTLILTAVGVWSMQRADYLQALYTDSPVVAPALVLLHSGLLNLSFLLFVHIFLALAVVNLRQLTARLARRSA